MTHIKNELDDESREAMVNYRFERANETMKEAAVMSDNGFYNAAVSRLYYACFYATMALLLHDKIPAQTHSGARTMLGLHFVNTGKLSKEAGKTLTQLFERRQTGDYDDFAYCDKEEVDRYTLLAENFMSEVEVLLK